MKASETFLGSNLEIVPLLKHYYNRLERFILEQSIKQFQLQHLTCHNINNLVSQHTSLSTNYALLFNYLRIHSLSSNFYSTNTFVLILLVKLLTNTQTIFDLYFALKQSNHTFSELLLIRILCIINSY